MVANLVVFYLAAGLTFALVFAWRGAGAIDGNAGTGSLGFRLLIIPGAALLWPLLAPRWLARRT